MCLAVPGKLIGIMGDDPLTRSGKIDFGGMIKEINLAFVPEAREGDYVLVHAGIAIGIIDQKEARRVFGYLEEISRNEMKEDRS